MPQVSSWSGKAEIKGSSEATRMALLTASLVGIQYEFDARLKIQKFLTWRQIDMGH
jgi:hypothetical protein